MASYHVPVVGAAGVPKCLSFFHPNWLQTNTFSSESFNGTSVIAFLLLSHVVTFPVTPIVDGLYASACAGKPTTES